MRSPSMTTTPPASGGDDTGKTHRAVSENFSLTKSSSRRNCHADAGAATLPPGSVYANARHRVGAAVKDERWPVVWQGQLVGWLEQPFLDMFTGCGRFVPANS